MADYELIALDTTGPNLRAPRSTDRGKLVGGLLVNGDREVSGGADNLTALRAMTGKTGEVIYLKAHTTAGDGGNGEFRWVSGAAPGTYVDNNGTIIVPTGGDGSAAWLRDYSGEVNVRFFGAVGDGVADDSAAIQAAVNYLRSINGGTLFCPKGHYLILSTIDLFQSSAVNIIVKGQGRSSTSFSTTANITVFNHAEHACFEDFSISQNGTTGTGRAFSTPTNKQAAYGTYQRLAVSRFKYGVWLRYSLWCSWRDVRFIDCAVGIKFSRNASPDDQTNPAAPGGWNLDPGYFHNQNTLDNVLCDGGEIGIWGTVNGVVFSNVTCQRQNGNGSSNTTAPAGMPGTGLYLQGRGTGVRTGAGAIEIKSFYAEVTQQPMVFEDCLVSIGAFFIQGNTEASKYPQGIKLSNAVIDGRGANGKWGQDWFNYQVVATDSTIFGDIGVGATNGGVSSLTNSTWYRSGSAGSGAVNYGFTITGTGTQNLIECEDGNYYQVTVGWLRDGSSVRSAKFDVFFWNFAAGGRVVSDANNSTGLTITLSGRTMQFNATDTLQKQYRVTVQRIKYCGQADGDGRYD